jgi:hypothetical protein
MALFIAENAHSTPKAAPVRFGQFSITRDCVLENHQWLAEQVFSKVCILRAEYLPDTDTFDYLGLSDLFEECEPYISAPRYSAILTRHEDGITRLDRFVKDGIVGTPQPMKRPIRQISEL